MNVCLLTSIAGNGGSASTAFHTARLLARAGWRATLFAPGDYWPERGRAAGVDVRTLELRRGFHPLSFQRDFRALRKFLIREKIDAVIVQKSPEQWLAAMVLSTLRRPTALVRLRGVVFAIKPSAFNRRLHNSMDAVICSASVIADQYKTLPGFKTDRVSVVLEGVDAARFSPATQQQKLTARLRFSLPSDSILIGTAGRPSPVKGHDLLARAFAKAFKDSSSPVRLCIFADESRRGPGSYQSMASLCEELGIRQKTDLVPGFVADMAEVYRALDVYVLPSRGSEGSSRAGLEASASGLPLIAARVGVLPDLIVDGITGRLVPPDDETALAEELSRLVKTWPAAKSLGAAARSRIEAELTDAKYTQKLTDILSAAVERRRSGTHKRS